MKIGSLEVSVISGGKMRLDGGAMFGPVPKPLWSKAAPADEHNRIQMDTNLLLIRTEEKRILVDTGLGVDLSAKEKRMFCCEGTDAVTSLGSLGLKAESIDMVLFTHLHWDHAAGATTKRDGEYAPTFPNATYLAQKQEYQDACDDFGTGKGGYQQTHFVPLMEAGQMELLEGSAEVAPGVRVRVTGGHTRGHQVVLLESDGQKAIYFADTMPTTAHLKPAWNMAYDLFPLDTVKVKLKLSHRAADEGWVCFFDHDPNVKAGRILRAGEDGPLTIEKMEM